MLMWFLLLIIGGFLLGFLAILTTIVLVTMIYGLIGGCTKFNKITRERMMKLKIFVPKKRVISTRTIEA